MNRIRILAFGSLLLATLAATAQQSNPKTAGVPTAAAQMKLLTVSLDLNDDQQHKIKPMLDDLHEATMKLVEDESLSREDRMTRVGNARRSADEKIRLLLNDDQKVKLTQLEHEPHPELHGTVEGK